MPNLETLLRQNVHASAILESLETTHPRIARLTGPAGSGKSHIALLVGATWRDAGGRCVVATGDDKHASRELYPFLSGLSTVPVSWTGLASMGSRSALQVADSLARSGGAATSIFDLLSSAFRQRTERLLTPYSAFERKIILDLRRLARSRPLLLVTENTHWWDQQSLWLLQELLTESLAEAFPQLRSLAVLVVDTEEEQSPIAPQAFASVVALCHHQTFRTSRCRPDQFASVLRSLGLKQELPGDVVHELYDATGGHLKLAEQLVAYAEDHSLGSLMTSGDTEYLSALVAARINSLGALSSEINALLARAAVIGLTFQEKDLACLADDLHTSISELIERAESINFLRREASQVSFSHDVLRTVILDQQEPSELRAYHARFADCLRILKPGDYGARAEELLKAGDRDVARDMFSLAAVAQLRRGDPASHVLGYAQAQFPNDAELHEFLSRMATGYAAIAAGDFGGPLPRLRTPLASESSLQGAERNYLAALCFMELQTASGVSEAQSILQSWRESVRAEAELTMRFLLLLQQAQVLAESFGSARETEALIERRLLARVRYDIDAAVMLQIQNRRAAALNVPEIARVRIQEAVSFFRRGTGDAIRDRLELYRALNNLAAIEIRLGHDAAAYATSQEAEELVMEAPDTLSRLDVLASNEVLAGVRSKALSLEAAIAQQRMLIESPEGGKDKFIQRCNLAAYLMLSSQDASAAEELGSLGEELRAQELVETYLHFYWMALSVASAALTGNESGALERHSEMDELVRTLDWPCAAYVRRRQELLGQFLGPSLLEIDRELADVVLVTARPGEIGPAWSYYSRLIPCCELSFWSDS